MERIADFLNTLGGSDLESLRIILDTYNSDYEIRKNDIEDVGFNLQTGNVWLMLSNGIVICSCFGQEPCFIAYDNKGEELEFDTYEEAVNKDYLV
jgi:hypothetical protein